MGRPRLAGLLVRCVLFAVLLPAAAVRVYIARRDDVGVFLLLGVCIALYVVVLFWGFVTIELRHLRAYRSFREQWARMDAGLVPDVPLVGAAVAAFEADPAVRKYTAELVGAGFHHAGDMGRSGAGEVMRVARVFLAPDGVTYLVVWCLRADCVGADVRIGLWPSRVRLTAETPFAGGAWVESANTEFTDRRPWVSPGSLIRSVPGVADPVEFYRDHASAVAVFAIEHALSATEHGSFAGYVQQQATRLEEYRRHRLDHPYSWGEHLRWYLQWSRQEYRG
jgi:hypothetical protein